MNIQRRQLVQGATAGSVLGLAALVSGCAQMGGGAGGPKVVVVGGGYGGATAAKYIRMWSDYQVQVTLVDVDAGARTLKFEFNDDLKADVLNVLPAMRAGDIAVRTGLATANQRWCEVDFLTHESKAAKFIHVVGDSIQTAPAMPKSGHMANQHGKTCAGAVVALLTGKQPNPMPIYNNTCYSFVSDTEVVHVASVHRYDAAQKTMLAVPGSGGVSGAASEIEGAYAMAWARNIWADTLA